MKPYIKFGLIVGVIAFFVIIPISALFGMCGPFVSIMAGAVAGFLSAYAGKALTRRDGAQSGAIAGAITGGFTLIGQLFGGALVLTYLQKTGTPTLFGEIPGQSAPASELALYYFAGLGTGLCFGLAGILLSAIAGGITGALGTREQPYTETPPSFEENQ